MKQAEPRSCCTSTVLIGRNGRGHWVAQEENGLYGGLFVNRAEAIKYALFENGRHPEAIITTPDVIELEVASSGPFVNRR